MVQDCSGWTGNGGDGIPPTAIRACKVTASESYTVSSLILHTTSPSATANVIIGLYSDSGGDPTTLLATTASTSSVTGAHEYPLVVNYAVTSGTDYWIAFMVDDSISVMSQYNSPTPPAGTQKYNARSYGAMPNPYPYVSSSTTGYQLCIVGGVTPSDGALLPPPPAYVRL